MSYFYTFRQRPTCAIPRVHTQLVCIEANSMAEMLQRAEYFGVDFDADPGCDCCTNQWQRPEHGSRMNRSPQWRARPLDYWHLSWLIFYRNDNLTDSRAIPLDSELNEL